MKKRVLSCVLVCLLVLSLCSMQVNADETAFRNAIADFMDNSVDEEGLYKWSFIICTLKAEGYSDAAIAGFLGCWKCESGNTVYAVEACGSREWTRIGDSSGTKYKYSEFVPGCAYQYGSNSTSWDSNKDSSGNHLPATPAPGRWTAGNGLGIAQWTAEREDRMTTFVETEGLPSSRYVTVSRWERSYPAVNGSRQWVWKTDKIPDFVGQLQFTVWEMEHYYSDTRDALKAITGSDEATAKRACWIFFHGYEHGGIEESSSMVVTRKNYAAMVVDAVSACQGTYGTAPVGADPATGDQINLYGTSADGLAAFGASMVNGGYWSESQLATYCKLTETNLESTLLKVTDRSNLDQGSLEGLVDWERNNDMQREEHGWIATLRILVQVVGILMMVWALFIYLAFWFDHINSFVYLDALHLVTIGQLHICQPGDKPTFAVGKKVETRTVNHIQIICICLAAILFGVLLISGMFYTLVGKLVRFITGFFG